MGGALAVLAAAERPERIARLTLISPAGPAAAEVDDARAWPTSRARLRRRGYAGGRRARRVGRALAAPRAALRLAREVHALDLSLEMETGAPRAASRSRWSRARPTRSSRRRTAAGRRSSSARSTAGCRLHGGHMWMLAAPGAARRGPRCLSSASAAPSLATVVREWGRIGCVGFGGPPAHIALLRRLVVDDRGWLAARRVRGRGRRVQPAAGAGVDAARDLLRAPRSRRGGRVGRRARVHRARARR